MSTRLIYPDQNTRVLHKQVHPHERTKYASSREQLTDYLVRDSMNRTGHNVFNSDKDNSCIICVGSTGAGKSSTVTKYTGVVTRSGSGTERVTRHCHLIRDIRDDQAPVWVDTVGWDDAECDDDDTFKDILRFINQYDITRVAAIIWNVAPNVRRDALLRKQANLINQFKEEEIWKNVLIVGKQSLNPDSDCAGAVRAAEEYSDDWPVAFTGYRFFTDVSVSPEQRGLLNDEATRQMFNIKTDVEVRDTLREYLDQMGPPVQVVFNTNRCQDCSVEGDKRLLPKYCHMEPSLIHPGVVECHHPGKIQHYHPTEHHLLEHEGRLKKGWYSNFMCGTLRRPRYSCCGRREGKPGCCKKWACCRQDYYDSSDGCSQKWTCCGAAPSRATSGCSPRYNCCLGGVTSAGCKRVCRKCGSDWGTPAGQCFVRDHNLVSIDTTTEEDTTYKIETIENEETRSFLPNKKPLQNYEEKKSMKLSNIIEKYPPIITYHLV